jgi:hypothetical protein
MQLRTTADELGQNDSRAPDRFRIGNGGGGRRSRFDDSYVIKQVKKLKRKGRKTIMQGTEIERRYAA